MKKLIFLLLGYVISSTACNLSISNNNCMNDKNILAYTETFSSLKKLAPDIVKVIVVSPSAYLNDTKGYDEYIKVTSRDGYKSDSAFISFHKKLFILYTVIDKYKSKEDFEKLRIERLDTYTKLKTMLDSVMVAPSTTEETRNSMRMQKVEAEKSCQKYSTPAEKSYTWEQMVIDEVKRQAEDVEVKQCDIAAVQRNQKLLENTFNLQ
jgi:hypothetical protein